MFLRNCWYVAAWESEVTPGATFARTICGDPVVMFRDASGTAHALEDRCCHRNLPLSMGKIEGSGLRCGYHGLKFDCTGTVIEVPGQTQVPPGAAASVVSSAAPSPATMSDSLSEPAPTWARS